MEGKIMIETTEGGLSVNTHISQVDWTDKMMVIMSLANALYMSELERFMAACFLVAPDMMAQVERDSVLIPGDIAEWIQKRQGGGGS